MAANGSGVIRRTTEDEAVDTRQQLDNWLDESWKEWPNEAQYEGLVEHRGPVNLSIKGTIPAWAAGSLFRTGPGLNVVEGTSRGTHHISHWFDGTAHTHRFDIVPPETASGSAAAAVTYSSRRQSDGVVAEIKNKGWQSSVSFAQKADPCIGIFAKFMSFFAPGESNNNVVVIPNMPGLGDSVPGRGHRAGVKNLVVTTDSATLQELDPKTLEPIGNAKQSSLHPDLKGPISCAHAQRDPETGDLFNFNLELTFPHSIYRIFRVNAATGGTDILATFSGPEYQPAYMHSFFLTENYVVFCVTSAHLAWGGLKILWERNILDALKPFDNTQPCQWVVVDRRHGKGVVAKFSTPAGFFFHSVNAFEQLVHDGQDDKHTEICLDVVLYDNADVLQTFYYDVLLDRNDATKKCMIDKQWYKSTQPRLVRYQFRIPPFGQAPGGEEAAVAEEVLSIHAPHVGELPTIHPRLAGKPYRYVYTATSRGLSTFTDSIAKTDVQTRETLIWSGPRAHSPGEPIFVPRPGATDEDDGVLLSVVLDGTTRKSYLLCLDAGTMEELGRAEADFAIAMGLHGSHQSTAARG